MTDKEIIIDGVDVSKCIHIDNWKHCNCCNDLIKTIYPKATKCHIEEDLRCEIYPNCYFKQLKHKEQEYEKQKQTLAEIKPILEFYANSNMGEEQPDKTYHIMLNGSYIMVYDPKPARQALQKISEVKNEN